MEKGCRTIEKIVFYLFKNIDSDTIILGEMIKWMEVLLKIL